MGRISKTMKIVPQAMRNLAKIGDEITDATRKTGKALERGGGSTGGANRATRVSDPVATPVTPGLGKGDPRYKRPKGFRKGVREKTWDTAARKSPDGQVRDPLTGKVMKKTEPWDMGHKDGHEYWKHRDNAAERGISRKQFLDEHNNPDHYRPELPSSNRSHRAEDHTADFYGP